MAINEMTAHVKKKNKKQLWTSSIWSSERKRWKSVEQRMNKPRSRWEEKKTHISRMWSWCSKMRYYFDMQIVSKNLMSLLYKCRWDADCVCARLLPILLILLNIYNMFSFSFLLVYFISSYSALAYQYMYVTVRWCIAMHSSYVMWSLTHTSVLAAVASV